MAETWREVSQWAGLYEVSDLGRVRSLGHDKFHKGRVLKPVMGGYKSGYCTVVLAEKSAARKARFYVHRLVAFAFLPNPLALPEVNHLNGVKTDNRVENLGWVSALQNGQHASRVGLVARGERRPEARLTEREVLAIKQSPRIRGTQAALAVAYRVSPATISLIIRGKNWRWLG